MTATSFAATWASGGLARIRGRTSATTGAPSLGANFNRYLGAELSADVFERRINIDSFASVGEYGITALVPQIRLRYPLFDGRLTPYFVAGAGVAFGEFNDRKAGTFGKSVDADRTMPVGTVGGGIEYFIADSVAVGVEVKYLFAGNQDIRIDGVSYSNPIDSLFASFGLRLFYPERPTAPPLEAREGPPRRLYLRPAPGRRDRDRPARLVRARESGRSRPLSAR